MLQSWEYAMRNSLAIVATAFVLSSSYAFAQAPQDRSDGPRPFAFSREDAGALIDARIAALHSGLKLTADQERMWPAFEQAYRDLAKLRLDRRPAPPHRPLPTTRSRGWGAGPTTLPNEAPRSRALRTRRRRC